MLVGNAIVVVSLHKSDMRIVYLYIWPYLIAAFNHK